MHQPYDTSTHPAPRAAFSLADAFTLRTALDALGGVRDLDTLDVACGHGGTAPLLARGGARRTVGVDSCPDRVRRAREQHAGADPAVEYVLADAADMPQLGPFDLATAVYLFSHAPDRTALHAMFRGIRANLRPGGRLLALVRNPGAFPRVDWSPYGMRILDRVPEGDAPLLRAQFLTEPPQHFEYREWAHADFAEAAVDAGFSTVAWQPSRTPPADPARDEAYWTAYRAWPVSSLMTCTA
ncbi:class I SAM-dependent methyltransferase [Streptomyces sp. NBC_00249]|uniref:class I SAM-dependent methyltransferase n=1 Tax=Streptomyces sp. NBC_00249 TaxID=2975690 RepID=UPI0022592ED0|nr:class I SAM-dependent methyltransferase [Streptomyces sp. NBC_00249]MCX5197084.1 class I SAM-dependent methyltransferase [Streptomyces sp. NBC_00249]